MIRALLERLRRAPVLPRPDPPVCLVGDIHGRHDLLARLLDAIAARPGTERARIVTLGDMIDRGPDSARVLDTLGALDRAGRATCLMGNHERMLLDFLAAPNDGGAWLRHGGRATLASFGLETAGDPADLAAALAGALPPGRRDWLAGLPLAWREGALAAVHAAADPRLPIERQMEETLLWGHADFGRMARRDGTWVVHGHTVTGTAPRMGRHAIGIDTGAWSRGVLSAAWFDADGLDIIAVHGAAVPLE